MRQKRLVWMYARSNDKHPSALFSQMEYLTREANRLGFTIVGASMDMGSGRSLSRMGLQRMLEAVRNSSVNTVLIQGFSRISLDEIITIQVLLYLHDHNAILIPIQNYRQLAPYLQSQIQTVFVDLQKQTNRKPFSSK